ncbi:MAG: hypothetical protein ACJ74U_20080 [Jatrophihabitantaceae bacterium]
MHDHPEAWRQAHALPIIPARPGSIPWDGRSGFMRARQADQGTTWEVIAVSNPDNPPEVDASFTEWARMRLYRLATNGPDCGDQWWQRNGWLYAYSLPVELPRFD